MAGTTRQKLRYTVSKKNKQNYFCYNYVKLPPNLTIFGKMMAICLKYMRCTHFPPHLTHVNALPCKTQMFQIVT